MVYLVTTTNADGEELAAAFTADGGSVALSDGSTIRFERFLGVDLIDVIPSDNFTGIADTATDEEICTAFNELKGNPTT